MTKGETYALAVGAQEYTIKLDAVTYSNGCDDMGGGFGGMGVRQGGVP